LDLFLAAEMQDPPQTVEQGIGAQMADGKWRQLCKAILQEPDPQKLLVLVEALNRELDHREQQPWHGHTNAQDENWAAENG
jgi:hypothetical protein